MFIINRGISFWMLPKDIMEGENILLVGRIITFLMQFCIYKVAYSKKQVLVVIKLCSRVQNFSITKKSSTIWGGYFHYLSFSLWIWIIVCWTNTELHYCVCIENNEILLFFPPPFFNDILKKSNVL